MNWLRKLDDALFSPPHAFQTILAFVAVRLSLVFDAGQEQSGNVESRGSAADDLIDALQDRTGESYVQIAQALGKIGAPAVQGLVRLLEHEDSEVRTNAALALGEMHDKRAVEPLIAVLNDAESAVRLEAAEALGRIGDRRAVQSLRAALEDHHPGVRDSAAKALKRIHADRSGREEQVE
jgi:HEAT repeat protein